MDGDSPAQDMLRRNIEHVEMRFLLLVGEGPGWPAFVIADLTDRAGLDFARRVEHALADSRARGVDPVLVHFLMLAGPYDSRLGWWNGCPPDHFPIAVVTDGETEVFVRRVPDGADEARRLRLLDRYAPLAVKAGLMRMAQAMGPVLVILADARDPWGAQVAGSFFGPDPVRRRLADTPVGTEPVMIWAVEPTGPTWPRDWGGPIAPGHLAVQLYAEGGVLNAVIAIPEGMRAEKVTSEPFAGLGGVGRDDDRPIDDAGQ